MPVLFGQEVSQDVYENNKHLEKPTKEPKTPARKDLDAELKQQFARTFEANWRLLGGPTLKPEFQFYPDRKWRADYYCEINTVDAAGMPITKKYLIELEGGVFTGGRHSRGGKSFIEDIFKYNMATLLGYGLIRIGTGMATTQYLQQIINFIREGSAT